MTSAAQLGASLEEVPTTGLVRLPCDPASVSWARSQFVAEFGQYLPARLCDDAVLILSELLSNALRHATPLPDGTLRVSWRFDPMGVELAVTDGGSSTRPQPRSPSLSALGGRGLAIVGALSTEWGIRDEDVGVTVWARVTGCGRRNQGAASLS